MSNAIEGLHPERLWKYFAEISKIPRCSKHEGAISKYVLDSAKRLGLEASSDNDGNVVVRKPASPGREAIRSVALQGHLDMVCEKNKETVHDFSKDPIELVRDGNVVRARGTTLGADNGIAVATNLAIMEDSGLEHGPLEFLFTVDEETGLTGASNLASNSLKSSTLINLDSEEEGALYVGCSGGKNTVAAWNLNREPVPAKHIGAVVTVKGLRGGHSGLEIDKGRGNAIKILVRVLLELADSGARVSTIEGGNKHNAIPREAESTVFVRTKNWEEAVNRVEKIEKVLRDEVSSVDPDLAVTIQRIKGKRGRAMKKAQQRKVLAALAAIPHGVIKMSADIPGLVETSTNLAVIKTTKKGIEVATSQRSSVASEIEEICQIVVFIFDLAGADVEARGGYPGWKPNLGSPILGVAKSTYQSMYGKEPEVKAIHAGLECGIIGEKYPGMDMVSLGPTLEEVHSPDERIYIDSVEKYWNYLLAILRNVN
jgi:dipeptidase D